VIVYCFFTSSWRLFRRADNIRHNTVHTDCSDSSSSSLSSDDEEILSRDEYSDELQFYYDEKLEAEYHGRPFTDHLARTHVEQMELFMRTVQNGDYDDEMGRDLRENYHQFDFPKVVLPAEWEERQRIESENIKNELRKFTCSIESDYGLFLMHSHFGPEPLRFVLSDESIHHHWEQLVAAYCMPNNLGRQLLMTIINVEMTKETIEMLASSLAGRISDGHSGFTFDNNNLCPESLMSLSTLVENNQQLTSFTLENNPIHDLHVALSLSNVLKSHTSIRRIHLKYCNLGNNADILSLILQTKVKSMELTGNNIDSSGAIRLQNISRAIVRCIFCFLMTTCSMTTMRSYWRKLLK